MYLNGLNALLCVHAFSLVLAFVVDAVNLLGGSKSDTLAARLAVCQCLCLSSSAVG